MRLDNSHKTEIMKCSKVSGWGVGGVNNRGWGYSLYEHAVMHISVYTEAFDSLHPQDRISKQVQKKNA